MFTRKQFGGFLLLSLIWGSTWAAIRVSVTHLPLFRSIALRFMIAALILSTVMWLKGVRWPTAREWPLLIGYSAVMVVLPFSATAWITRSMGSGLTAIFSACTPLLVLLFEFKPYRYGRKILPFSVVSGMLGCLCGILLVANTCRASAPHVWNILAAIGVVVGGSWSSVFIQPRLQAIPAITITTTTSLCGGAVLSVISFLLERRLPSHWNSSSITAILFLGILSSACGFLLYYWLMKEIRPYQLAARYFLMPAIAVFEGIFFLNEPMTLGTGVGGFFIVISIIPVLHWNRRARRAVLGMARVDSLQVD